MASVPSIQHINTPKHEHTHTHTHTQTYSHVSSKSGQALSAAASHPQQEGIPHRLTNDARDLRYMTYGIQEKDELHLSGINLIIVI